MGVSPGTKFGPYEVLSALGAGGMGEVYRARDTRLGRDVAIKILPSHLGSDAHLKQRFEREARAISVLNHPNICALYDVGHQDGVDFLVMELLEGETLAERIKRGSLPVEQVLKIGIEIADALEKAHRQGIIHRDLKPGNIMLTKSGTKLMDFGLARTAAPALAATSPLSGGRTQSSPVSPLTSTGGIVGTLEYMPPEQIEGKEADVRSDIFALGAMLYEMATGKRAFQGKSQISIISAILEKDPEPIGAVLPSVPPIVDHVIRTCLAKDPDERFQTAHDVKLQLSYMLQSGISASPRRAAEIKAARSPLVLAAAAALAIALATLVVLFSLRLGHSQVSYGVTRFTIPLSAHQELAVDTTQAVAVSPDGKTLAYVAAESGLAHLYVRPLDQFDPVPISDSEGATFPFFSSDGGRIAFFSQGKLKKSPLTRGGTVPICDIPSFLGGTWTSDDDIIFSTPGFGLEIVSASGGIPRKLKIADGKPHSPARPQVLPGGKWIVFTDYASAGQQLLALRIESGEVRALINNAQGGYYSHDRLAYYSAGAVWSVPFDLKSLSVSGSAVQIASNVDEHNLVEQLAASQTGILAYAPGGTGNFTRNLFWVHRNGSSRKIDLPAADYVDPTISPDGKRFAIAIRRVGEQQLAVYDIDRAVLMRMPAEGSRYAAPVWTPDGRQLIYDAVGPSQKLGVYRMAADGSSGPQLLHELPANGHVTSISRQNTAAVMITDPVSSTDLWLLSLNGDHRLAPFRRTPAMERQGSLSPDGYWLAYVSNESGRSEVYVERVPGPGGRWQISTNGGEQPRWSRDGREIFYRNGTKMMRVSVQTRPAFSAAKPVELFDLSFDRGGAVAGYDITPDGQSFLMSRSEQPNPTEIRVVVGWPEELNGPNLRK